jgi:Putative CRISPR-associated protein (Cas_VVA1548)
MENTVIITRHAGLVEWLRLRGIEGIAIPQATPEEVTGKVVIGALPPYLACLAEEVISVDMPNLRADQRGKDLSPAEMDEAGAAMRHYVTREVSSNPQIGQIRIDESRVLAYLTGYNGVVHTCWYHVGYPNSTVYSIGGTPIGRVKDLPLDKVYADPADGVLTISLVPNIKS